MQSPEEVSEWLTEGTTYLLPKSEATKHPKNYRPITCLSTTYKILTSILTERMYSFLERNSILPQEQKGCRRNSYGCKDQLLINKMILEHYRKSKRKNLSTAWFDYKKAFDSVSHEWILKALQLYKISPIICNFLGISMTKWKLVYFSHTIAALVGLNVLESNEGFFKVTLSLHFSFAWPSYLCHLN